MHGTNKITHYHGVLHSNHIRTAKNWARIHCHKHLRSSLRVSGESSNIYQSVIVGHKITQKKKSYCLRVQHQPPALDNEDVSTRKKRMWI